MTTGEKIKRARLDKGLTQKELGEKLGGISQQQIGQWETGKANPKIETLKRIADALQVGLWEIIELDEMDLETLKQEVPKMTSQLTPEGLEIFNSLPIETLNSDEPLPDNYQELHQKEQEEAAKRAPKFFFYDEKGNKIESKNGEAPKWTDRSVSKAEAIANAEAEELERLQNAYKRLNRKGKIKAVERVEELTEISRYIKEDPPINPFPMLPKRKK